MKIGYYKRDYSSTNAKLEFNNGCSAILFITHVDDERSPQVVYCNKIINRSHPSVFKYYIKELVASNQTSVIELPPSSDYIFINTQVTISIECYIFGDAKATFTELAV